MSKWGEGKVSWVRTCDGDSGFRRFLTYTPLKSGQSAKKRFIPGFKCSLLACELWLAADFGHWLWTPCLQETPFMWRIWKYPPISVLPARAQGFPSHRPTAPLLPWSAHPQLQQFYHSVFINQIFGYFVADSQLNDLFQMELTAVQTTCTFPPTM